ncbi:MAG: polyprenol monophosphomannose synthase [Bacteriovoracaceae bacterium]
MDKVLVATATYNEVDNIQNLIGDIFTVIPNCEILVVDDKSPDGTGELLDRLKSQNSKIHVIHRAGKLGLGTAHLAIMDYAVKNNFGILVTMDADFSHHPKYLSIMLDKMKTYDFVTGSRYVPGGQCQYGFYRTLISKTANFLSRFLLGIHLHECTTSYRGFKNFLLKDLLSKNIKSNGYSFFVESIFYVCRISKNVSEFPIVFEDRRHGVSKISKKEIVKSILTLLRLTVKRVF